MQGKREFQFATVGNATSTSNNIDVTLQNLFNEVISLRKHINRPTHSFYQPCQEGSRHLNGGKTLQIMPAQ